MEIFMLESLNKRGRPITSPRSVERSHTINQMPEHIKARINARKVRLALTVKNVATCASESAYKKKVNDARKQASRTAFTEFEKSMDKWWTNFRRLGLTQDYVDGLECFERGIELSLDEQSRFLQAKLLFDQKQKTNSQKATTAVNARWSNDKDHVDDKKNADQLMMQLLKTERGRKLNTSGRARWLKANWPNSNKPADRTLLRYVSNKKCANTEEK
jgi:hypothetical protein